MKTIEELDKECEELNQFCRRIDPEKLNEISLKTGQTKFTEDDMAKLGCLSKGEKTPIKVINKEVKRRKRRYRIIKDEYSGYVVYVHTWFGWFQATMHGYGNSFSRLIDAQYYIKMHSGEIPKDVTTIVYEE